jgi:ABC-type polar amino acid transport system ATPase subunit
MLRIHNLSKHFQDRLVLNQISLTINTGEIAVLLGSSGVGKSTLLRILNNLEAPDGGSIELHNKPLDLKTVNRSHTVGMVFQHFNLFDHLTVEENITVPLTQTTSTPIDHAISQAHILLAHYGLADKATSYPASLSGGQKQRLAIARTVAMRPKIICFDEPTSALDPLLTAHVATSIQELARDGFIVLVATHDTTLIEKLVCTIYLMQQGSFIANVASTTFYANRAAYPKIDQFMAGIVHDIENCA